MGSPHASPPTPYGPVIRRVRAGRGFTLVELLVTMAIGAILMAVAVPAMRSFLADQSAAASADELAESIRLARTEATKRGMGVIICASRNTANASPTCSTAGDDGWLTGWIIQDVDGNLIRVQNPMRGIGTVDSGGKDRLQFAANGMNGSGATSFELTPTGDSVKTRMRTIDVNAQGRVKVTKGGGS
jgi:type IV fimbrial biogenesis protein FimT